MTAAPVCVFGAEGMLGHILVDQLAKARLSASPIGRGDFEIGRSHDTELGRFVTTKGQFVINCTAATPGALLDRLITVNSRFPRILAAHAASVGAHLIHVSTDGVFSGRAGDYDETALPDATDDYGVSKLLGESSNSMVLRTSIVGRERHGSRYLLERFLQSSEGHVDGFTNHRWNGVTSLTLARAIVSIITLGLFSTGTYHIHSPEAVTKHELLLAIRDAFGSQVEVRPVRTAQDVDRTLKSIHYLSGRLVDAPISEQLRQLAAK